MGEAHKSGCCCFCSPGEQCPGCASKCKCSQFLAMSGVLWFPCSNSGCTVFFILQLNLQFWLAAQVSHVFMWQFFKKLYLARESCSVPLMFEKCCILSSSVSQVTLLFKYHNHCISFSRPLHVSLHAQTH